VSGPAETRSAVRRDHAVLTPESHVPAPLAGWSATQGIVLVSPRMGARFSQVLAVMDPGALAAAPLPGIERFLYVLEGGVRLVIGESEHDLGPGSFALLPADAAHTLLAWAPTRICLIEKPYVPLAGVAVPEPLIGREALVSPEPLNGDPDLLVRALVPDDPGHDLAVNTMAYAPGAALGQVEVHVMEHGLLMLEGRMVYRLGESWYPVQAGDAIWMAPHCPQWACAYGKGQARYLIYKDWRRDPLGALP
jgi:(S)-ureidoglycine aminohydrolase